MDQNQSVIQSLKGADPTMVHQADAPNPVPNIIDAFKSFSQGGLQGLANQQGMQTPEWSQKLGSVLSSPEANVALGALRLRPTLGSVKGSYDMLNDAGKEVGYIDTKYYPNTKTIHIGDIASSLNSPLAEGSVAKKANRLSDSLGFSNIRSLINELRQIYPEARSIAGTRISGMRRGPMASGRNDRIKMNLPENQYENDPKMQEIVQRNFNRIPK